MPALSDLRASDSWAAIAEGWRWWTGELAAMLPERFRPDPDKAARADILLGRDAIEIEIVVEGVGQRLADPRRIEELDAEGWAELAALIERSRARIVLTAPDAYVTSVSLPKAARKRLRSAVALQLSQLAPVDPDLLRWAMALTEIGPDRIIVRVAMARAARVEALQALCEANGIVPPPVHAATPEGTLELAPGHDGSRTWSKVDRRAWAIAALLILTIPLTTALGAMGLEATVQGRIAALQREAGPRLRAEAKARQSEGLRHALRPLFAHPSASATIEELAARLPMTDHVKSIEQAGNGILQFTLESADPEGAQAALAKSPLLPNVAVSDILPAQGGRLAATYRTAPR